MKRVLLLVTTFNRRELTVKFLESIKIIQNDPRIEIEVNLIDDNSSDGTQAAVKELFPDVVIWPGTGYLYWSGSLRYAFDQIHSRLAGFDGVLFANDDIEIYGENMLEMIQVAHENSAMIGASIVSRSGEIEATGYKFGRVARPKFRRVKQNAYLQECDLLPAHLLYVPLEILKQVLPLSNVYSHGFSDFDMSLKARKLGIKRLLSSKPGGIIDEKHNYSKEQSSIRMPLSLLFWRLRFNPKSPPLKETANYLSRVSRYLWPIWLFFFYLPNLRSMLVSLIKIDCVRMGRTSIGYIRSFLRLLSDEKK